MGPVWINMNWLYDDDFYDDRQHVEPRPLLCKGQRAPDVSPIRP